jgi:hypothetical protein
VRNEQHDVSAPAFASGAPIIPPSALPTAAAVFPTITPNATTLTDGGIGATFIKATTTATADPTAFHRAYPAQNLDPKGNKWALNKLGVTK